MITSGQMPGVPPTSMYGMPPQQGMPQQQGMPLQQGMPPQQSAPYGFQPGFGM